MFLITGLIYKWQDRLRNHLKNRKFTPKNQLADREDWRYKEMREKWEADGNHNYYVKSYSMFLLQTLAL